MHPTVQKEVDVLVEKMKYIGRTVCTQCQGRGHTMKKCATYKRLIKLSSGVPSWKTLLNSVRSIVISVNSKVYEGK